MKTTFIPLFIIFLTSCDQQTDKNRSESVELITNAMQQDSIFVNLLKVTGNSIPDNLKKDSLAFLLLPLQASCPSCRKKTVDSIIKYNQSLLPNHYIILSADGGKKKIGSYFKEEDGDLPENRGQVFLDSNNLAFTLKLSDEKPTIYYTYNNKAHKRVASIPATVKEDLHQFFSGKHYNQKGNDQ